MHSYERLLVKSLILLLNFFKMWTLNAKFCISLFEIIFATEKKISDRLEFRGLGVVVVAVTFLLPPSGRDSPAAKLLYTLLLSLGPVYFLARAEYVVGVSQHWIMDNF